MKNIFAIFVLGALFLSGCASKNEKYTRLILIKSEPTGAPIIVNSLPMSKTPVSVEVESTESGNFIRRIQITALPQTPDLYTQVVSYPAYSPANPEASEVPEEINFDMRVSPAANSAKSDAQKK